MVHPCHEFPFVTRPLVTDPATRWAATIWPLVNRLVQSGPVPPPGGGLVCITLVAILLGTPGGVMIRRQTLKKIGGSVATVLPKSMLDRFHLDAGDDIYVVETGEGLLITPFDPDFADAMAAYARGAKKYRNALRKLAQ